MKDATLVLFQGHSVVALSAEGNLIALTDKQCT